MSDSRWTDVDRDIDLAAGMEPGRRIWRTADLASGLPAILNRH